MQSWNIIIIMVQCSPNIQCCHSQYMYCSPTLSPRICRCTSVCVCVYIDRERERETHTHTHTTHTFKLCLSLHIHDEALWPCQQIQDGDQRSSLQTSWWSSVAKSTRSCWSTVVKQQAHDAAHWWRLPIHDETLWQNTGSRTLWWSSMMKPTNSWWNSLTKYWV